ncbi:MAG: S8/S53 family peptidase [Thermoleophilia bacterium]
MSINRTPDRMPDPEGARRQVHALREPPSDLQTLRRVTGRHPAPRDPSADSPILHIAALPLHGDRVLGIVNGELLVRDDHAKRAAEILAPLGYRAAPSRALDGKLGVVRFTSANVPRLVAIDAQVLRARGMDANANVVHAAAMRGKSALPPVWTDTPLPTDVDPSVGTGAHIVVIDTGLAADVGGRGDTWLGGIPLDPANTDLLTDINDAQGDRDQNQVPYLDDAAGHGTFVTGVVRQCAPGATVTMMRALDSDGLGSEDQLAAAIVAAGELSPHVIVIAAAEESPDDSPPVALAGALACLDPEILVVAAAGNSPDTRPSWPAAFRRVVAVAGLRQDGEPADDWSKRGPWVTCSAVAEDVLSTFVHGTENPDLMNGRAPGVWDAGEGAPVAIWAGTSFAAPRVAGLIAARVGTGTTPRQALADLLASGTPRPGFGVALT